jgi:putative glutamine amidotransferase
MSKSKVWLPLDYRMLGDEEHSQAPFFVVAQKYCSALRDVAQTIPVTYPLATLTDLQDLLSQVDGVLLPGSPTNIHPSHFDEDIENTSLPLDPARDALTLALVKACISHAVPLLGICRGFQEINVALGGSLHQQVHLIPGYQDHREDKNLNVEERFADKHLVTFTPNSIFCRWANAQSTQVNSLHGQGIKKLAKNLKAHAYAPDGLIEAFEITIAKAFAYGVQWHAEWKCQEIPFSTAIFSAFGKACAKRYQVRRLCNLNK